MDLHSRHRGRLTVYNRAAGHSTACGENCFCTASLVVQGNDLVINVVPESASLALTISAGLSAFARAWTQASRMKPR